MSGACYTCKNLEKLTGLSEVKTSELTQWLNSLIEKDVKPIRERASYLVSRSTDALSNIRKISASLSGETSDSNTPSETTRIEIAKNFGIRIAGLVDEVKNPEEISYETLSEFLSRLRKFHGQLIYAGSIWIRKLDPRYKEDVRKMELSLSEIRTFGKMLEEHLDRKYMTVRKYEVLLKDAEILSTVSIELDHIEDEIQKIKAEKETAQSTSERLVEEKRQLEASPKLVELSALESNVNKNREEIVNLFRPLEKPIEKLLKLPEREKQKLNPTVATNLSDYVAHPVDKLCKSNINPTELESALNGLQTMLEANALDLKDSRVRAALKTIPLIKDKNNLDQLREKYLKAKGTYKKTSDSEEVRSLLLKRDEIESKRAEAEQTAGRLDRTLSGVDARKEELSKRFTQLKNSMEKSIQEVTGQSIRISNSQ
jgi:hypothetical protein